MPKRKTPGPLDTPHEEGKDPLEAIRQALAKPLPPSPRHTVNRGARQRMCEMELGLAVKGPITAEQFENARAAHEDIDVVVVKRRRGRRETHGFRVRGKAGADLPVPPIYRAMYERQRDFETECAKVDRALTTTLRNRSRRTNATAEERARQVALEFDRLTHLSERNRASVVAEKLNVPVRTVRDIIRKKKRRTPKGTDSD